VDSIDELKLLEAAENADDARRIGNRANSIAHDWAFEKTLLAPLPSQVFDTTLTVTPRVDRYAQMMRCNQYFGTGPVHWSSASGPVVGLDGHCL
jgi:hypothetical protein